MQFDAFPLGKQLLQLLKKNGIETPTPVQEKILPLLFEGRDVIAQSETGSGKTLSFALPLIELIDRKDGISALILAPTRELAVQITNEFIKFSQGKHLGVTPIYGGVSINNQIKKIDRTNIIVATPGRLIDLVNRGNLRLSTIRFLVFDEADRMLDMGFLPDIERIVRMVPTARQTMLFSATVPKEIIEISRKYLKNAAEVRLASEVQPEFLHQTYYHTNQQERLPLLIHLLQHERDLSIVFCNRKHVTAKIAKRLTKYGVAARCLHGDMSQSQRERATADFKHKKFTILVATDVAARGLHIDDITHVYNYEIPRDVESYTHRVGRTARAGKKGEAISLVATEEERKFFKQILFTYEGNIALKHVDAGKLPVIVEEQKSGGHKSQQQSSAPARGDQKSFRRHQHGRNRNRRRKGSV
jgi:ATP-dependent RNA helicase DeaD